MNRIKIIYKYTIEDEELIAFLLAHGWIMTSASTSKTSMTFIKK